MFPEFEHFEASSEISGWDLDGRPFCEWAQLRPAGRLHTCDLHTPVSIGAYVVVRTKPAATEAPLPPVVCRVLDVHWKQEEQVFVTKIADCSSPEARAFEARTQKPATLFEPPRTEGEDLRSA